MKKITHLIMVCIICIITTDLNTQVLDHSWEKLVNTRDKEWYQSDSAKIVADNVILYQKNNGGWPKNTSMHKYLSNEKKKLVLQKKDNLKDCTIDNHATTLEMTFLSNMYKYNPEEKYKDAFLNGLNYLLEAQYDNGGWPQFYPLKKDYSRHITFNDNAMINVMRMLQNIHNQDGTISIIPDSATMKLIENAMAKGLDCILKTQYIQNGKLSSWCAQYDEISLEPASARAYELISLSGHESAGIVLFLMSIQDPSDEVKKAVEAAVSWFEETKLTGFKIEMYKNDSIRDKRIADDSMALPLWGRFMELDDNTVFFCDRDGKKRNSLYELSQERRVGYLWYSDRPRTVLEKYKEWKKLY